MSPVPAITATLALFCLCGGIRAQDTGTEDNCNFDFGYSGDNGPATWGEHCPQCNGENQSPINIDTSQVDVQELPALDGSLYENRYEEYQFSISNDGFTATVILDTPQPLTLHGGPLDGEYTLEKLQFCWGSNDSVGSEHTFNGERFPMEAQWVLYQNDEDGEREHELRIIQLFELSDDDNTALSVIADSLPDITEPGSELQSSTPISYDSIFSGYPADDFYAYNGNLTTPPCTEGVYYLVFPPGLPGHRVNEDVLEAFRSLKSSDGGPLVNNFRPLQELNGRSVIVSSRSSQFQNCSGHHEGHQSRSASRREHHGGARVRGAARHHH